MTVKHFSVDYQKVNERGVFSPGDILSGKVTVVTNKKIKAQCLLVKAKGKAQVGWCEQDGEATRGYGDKKKYFNLEHIILQDKNKGDGLCCLLLITKTKARRLKSNVYLTFFSLFVRLRNHQPGEKCVPIHLCDSKHVCAPI